MKGDRSIELVIREYQRANEIHGPFKSLHEGYAIMLEEFDELWDEIKKRNPDMNAIQEEVVQIGAMALRFLVDICEEDQHNGTSKS